MMDHHLPLPGFRFHPTEEELLDFYLKNRLQGKKLPLEIITTVHLYRFDPWELPGMARTGEKEWYFYVPRDHRKPGGGRRPSRTTERGFWKATGCDRPVRSAADPKRLIGLKKTLVYYEGRAPRGSKTEWVMNEYRLPEPPAPSAASSSAPPLQEDIVLCKIHRKAASMKELEQAAAAAMEDEWMAASVTTESAPTSHDDQGSFDMKSIPVGDDLIFDMEDSVESAGALFVGEEEKEEEAAAARAGVSVAATTRSWRPSLPELEVPRSTGMEWLQQDPGLSQTRSPWLVDFWSPSFVSILNF